MADQPVTKPPRLPDGMTQGDKTPIWMSCRATPGCEGKQARLVFSKDLGMGGTMFRYRCLTCQGTFHVTR